MQPNEIVNTTTPEVGSGSGAFNEKEKETKPATISAGHDGHIPATTPAASAHPTANGGSSTTAADPSGAHLNIPWPSLDQVPYRRVKAGQTISVYPPDMTGPLEIYPSEQVLFTRASQKLPPNSPPLVHCAHFHLNRRCTRGDKCGFAHVVRLAGASSTSPQAGSDPKATTGLPPQQGYHTAPFQQQQVLAPNGGPAVSMAFDPRLVMAQQPQLVVPAGNAVYAASAAPGGTPQFLVAPSQGSLSGYYYQPQPPMLQHPSGMTLTGPGPAGPRMIVQQAQQQPALYALPQQQQQPSQTQAGMYQVLMPPQQIVPGASAAYPSGYVSTQVPLQQQQYSQAVFPQGPYSHQQLPHQQPGVVMYVPMDPAQQRQGQGQQQYHQLVQSQAHEATSSQPRPQGGQGGAAPHSTTESGVKYYERKGG